MGYYCISNAIIEGYENRIFQVCNRQLCYFFSIQSYGRAYPTPRGALPNMWGKYNLKTLVESERTLFSVEQAFVGRDEKGASLKTPA